MTLSESIVWSLARSVLVASVAIWPVMLLMQQIESCVHVKSRKIWLVLSVSPFFVPELLTGFHYRLIATQLSSGAGPLVAAIFTELLYFMLLLSRCVAVGVAVCLLLPRSDVTRESLQTWNLLRPVANSLEWRRGWLMLRVTGPYQNLLVAWSLMALVTMQEFETAALMQIDRHPIAWSVWLFDAHAARQPLTDSLLMIVMPLVCELLLLSPALFLLWRSPSGHASAAEATEGTSVVGESSHSRKFVVAFLLLSTTLMFVWPVFGNVKSAVLGFVSMSNQMASVIKSTKQILTSTAFAAAATFLSMKVAAALCSSNSASTGSQGVRRILLVVLMPGLSGSLVLSLVLLAMFQSSLLRMLYETWLPMLLGQTLAVLPRALAIVLLLKKLNHRESIHAAQLLAASSDRHVRRRAGAILWRVSTARWLLGGLVVAHWCFWDVTVASILRPVDVEPVVTRLYNEMHYGRAEALISLSLLAAMTPVVIWLMLSLISLLKAMLIPTSKSVNPER